MGREANRHPDFFSLMLFSIPYAVGFGILYAWLRMRFTKILIAVTADQFALQRTWFNRQKFETVVTGPEFIGGTG